MTTSGRPTAAVVEGQPAPALPWLLRRVNQRYLAATASGLADAGLGDLPRAGSWVLSALGSGLHQPNQLVAAMGITKQAVSKLLDTLVAAGLVERRPHRADRRRTDLHLTPEGRRALAVIHSAVRVTDRRFESELGAESFTWLTHMLDRLARTEA